VLAPHPDDETLGFTGLIEAYVRAGKPVHVVVITDGDAYCEACRFWKNSSVDGPMCTAEELSNFATPENRQPRRGPAERRAPPRRGFSVLRLRGFSGYPDTGLAAAWRNLAAGKTAEPLRRSDFSRCTSCETCGYGEGPQTTLTADTLTASLRELIAAEPDGALIASTHWLDGHPDHAALGNFVRRLNGEGASPHAVA
jgi:LmbE family N-acetylglucosaminyl deacetylase